jgi:hypothetical protein
MEATTSSLSTAMERGEEGEIPKGDTSREIKKSY